jgi:uncharacterized membrane protein YdjX (TVP38/TMEM64 family)
VRIAAAITGVLLTFWWGGRRIAPEVLPVVAWIHRLGPLGPVLFVVLYLIAVPAMIPGAWLTVAGGAVFGFIPAVVYGLVGAVLGSTAAFLLGRHAMRRVVARRLESMPRLAAIDRAVSAKGRRIIVLLRLSPIAPFNFLNYALGLTTISVWDFIAASIGMVPGAIMYSYAGAVAGAAIKVAGQAAPREDASYYAMLALGLAATVAATAVVARTARRALQDV